MKLRVRVMILLVMLIALVGTGVLAPTFNSAVFAATEEPTAAVESGVFPRTVTDGTGAQIQIAAKPVRIVSVILASDEILLSLVEHDRIAAVTANALDVTQSNVAEVAKTIPTQLAKADPEAIIALKPDLVIISNFTDAGVIKQLQDAKLPVLILSNFASIKDIDANITLLGEATGEENTAGEIIGEMERQLYEISEAVKGVEKPLSVIYYAPDGYSDGPGTTVDEIINRAGGVNGVVAGGIKDMFPQLSDEFLVTQDPDVIMLAGFNSYSPNFVDNFMKKPAFQTLKAIKNSKIVVANDAHITSVSQYIVEGVADIAALLYPDKYQIPATPTAEASLEATMTATAAK